MRYFLTDDKVKIVSKINIAKFVCTPAWSTIGANSSILKPNVHECTNKKQCSMYISKKTKYSPEYMYTCRNSYDIKLTVPLMLAENACLVCVLPLRGRQLRDARIPAMIGARAKRRRREVRKYFVGRHHVQQASRCGGTCVRAASESSVFDRYRWRPIRAHRCT